MNAPNRICAALAASLAAACPPCLANGTADSASGTAAGVGPVKMLQLGVFEKSVSTQTLGARGTITTTASMFGGFEIRNSADVYIAVRGNSLGTLGITQNYLDAPRTRLYNSAGVDLVFDNNGRGGFNGCISGNAFSGSVVSFYQFQRGQPVVERDSCLAVNLPAGVYTFSVTPSIPGVTSGSTQSLPPVGEVLFEVTLSP